MSPQPVSRRSVTSGLAWSIPVVAGVVAAPAFAISTGQCGTIVWTSTSLSGSTRTGVLTTQRGEQTMTFSFREADGTVVTPSYIEFNAYDITSSDYPNDTRYPYSDQLSVNNGTLQVLEQAGMVRTRNGEKVAAYNTVSYTHLTLPTKRIV